MVTYRWGLFFFFTTTIFDTCMLQQSTHKSKTAIWYAFFSFHSFWFLFFWKQPSYHSLLEMQKSTYMGALRTNSFIQSSLDKQALAECTSYVSTSQCSVIPEIRFLAVTQSQETVISDILRTCDAARQTAYQCKNPIPPSSTQLL